MNNKVKFTCVLVFLFLGRTGVVLAATTSSQVVSSQTQQDINARNDRMIEHKIYQSETPTESSNDNQGESPSIPSNNSNEKFLVKKIDLQGSTILTNLEINKLVLAYEGTQMSLKDAQKLADIISDVYRKKGFITSRAYVPAQTMQDNVLTIKVIEGKLGNVEVKGNKYFSTHLLKGELHLTKSGYFDYSALQKSLVYINQQPDRTASTVLVPGQEPGTTDVVLNVKDRLPIHAGFIYDDYGSRYIDHNRYALTLEDNNLLGFDDRLFAKIQTTSSDYMRFGQVQYVVPVTETLNIGAYGLYSDLVLTKEFAALEAKGKARVLGIFFDKALIQDVGFEWRVNGGFDYKNISNYELGNLISRDKERVVKMGTEFDITDRFGRTIISPEINIGLPSILNGMDPKDGLASRLGSGGSFQKELISLYRLQPLPLSTSLLWKNTAQWSHHNLPASEQFEIGGPTSVRGYGPAEFSGDKGLYSSLEWSIPPYFIPESVKVPFTQDRLKDSLRFVTFYDLGFVHLNNTSVGEKKDETLRGYGYGARLNVHDNVSCRLEVGYPIGRKSTDGSNAHLWFEIVVRF